MSERCERCSLARDPEARRLCQTRCPFQAPDAASLTHRWRRLSDLCYQADLAVAAVACGRAALRAETGDETLVQAEKLVGGGCPESCHCLLDQLIATGRDGCACWYLKGYAYRCAGEDVRAEFWLRRAREGGYHAAGADLALLRARQRIKGGGASPGGAKVASTLKQDRSTASDARDFRNC